MSKVTFFTTRQKVLEVLAAGADIAYTAVPCSTFVPVGSTALIVKTELEINAPSGSMKYATSSKRKDVTQGICSSDFLMDMNPSPMIVGDNAIIPLDASRQFEYDLIGIYAGITYNIRVWAIGYLT